MLLIRRIILLLSTSIVLLLASSAAAQASFTFTTPTEGALVQPGSVLRLGYEASCPAGMYCGYSSWRWMEAVRFDMVYVPATGGPTSAVGAYQLQGEMDQRFMEQNMSENMTAGTWLFKAGWSECTAPDGKGTCTKTDAVRRLRVPAVIGTKSSPIGAIVRGVRNNRNKIETDFGFGCNATEKNFRFNLLLQKQVKVGKRMRWVQVSRRNNQRVDGLTGASTACSSRRFVMIPKSIDAKTNMRVAFQVRSVGIQPAARARNFFAKPFTRATIPGSNSGSISIGG